MNSLVFFVCLPGEHITDTYITETDTTELENLSHNIIDTGTPLIGRFLGPRKNRLNRNPSY